MGTLFKIICKESIANEAGNRYGRVFHPTKLLHQIIAQKIREAMLDDHPENSEMGVCLARYRPMNQQPLVPKLIPLAPGVIMTPPTDGRKYSNNPNIWVYC
jgi:hypothetical protein